MKELTAEASRQKVEKNSVEEQKEVPQSQGSGTKIDEAREDNLCHPDIRPQEECGRKTGEGGATLPPIVSGTKRMKGREGSRRRKKGERKVKF